MKFRKLRADEIDCRIATINEKGLTLLLYKDARVDQNILDESVGCFNWQKSYTRDNANCTVSIWDELKKQWISKEDTGTESFTEKEKGLASDSFKRACFCWGIGRELYSAPFIWISASECNIKPKGDKYQCYDKFAVTEIAYMDGNITSLVIKNLTKSKVVFKLNPVVKDEEQQAEEEQKQIEKSKISDIKVKALIQRCETEGVPTEKILKLYKVKQLEDLTEKQFAHIHEGWEKIKVIEVN